MLSWGACLFIMKREKKSSKLPIKKKLEDKEMNLFADFKTYLSIAAAVYAQVVLLRCLCSFYFFSANFGDIFPK